MKVKKAILESQMDGSYVARCPYCGSKIIRFEPIGPIDKKIYCPGCRKLVHIQYPLIPEDLEKEESSGHPKKPLFRRFDTDITVRLFERWLKHLAKTLPKEERDSVPFLIAPTFCLGFPEAIKLFFATFIGMYEGEFHGKPIDRQTDEDLDRWIERAEIMFNKMVQRWEKKPHG